MRSTLILSLGIILFYSCEHKVTNPVTASNHLLLAENVKTVLPMESDTMTDKSDMSNATNKFDREKMISSLVGAVLNKKLKAYRNYPDGELSVADVQGILTQWDSTNMAEDPNHPGIMVSAPISFQINGSNIPHLKFNEKIELDTINYHLNQTVNYVSLYTYDIDYLNGGIVKGENKVFDIKLNE